VSDLFGLAAALRHLRHLRKGYPGCAMRHAPCAVQCIQIATFSPAGIYEMRSKNNPLLIVFCPFQSGFAGFTAVLRFSAL
jgi:hypothetical protein